MESFRLIRWLEVLRASVLAIHIPDDFFLLIIDEDGDYISPADTIEGRVN